MFFIHTYLSSYETLAKFIVGLLETGFWGHELLYLSHT